MNWIIGILISIVILFTIAIITIMSYVMSEMRESRESSSPPENRVRGTGQPSSEDTWRKKVKKFWEENELVILLAWLMFHVLAVLVLPNWWPMHVISNGPAWGVQVILILFALMIPKGDGKLIHKLGKIGVRIATVGLVLVVFWYLVPTSWSFGGNSTSTASATNVGAEDAQLVMIPVTPEWSEVVPIRVTSIMRNSGVVFVKTDDNVTHRCQDGHGCEPKMTPSDTLQFQLEKEGAGTVRVIKK